RLMYGERDDPAGVLAGLGGRLEAVMLPDDVSPAVVETVARSLRVPYAAVELADGTGGFRATATHGAPVGQVHTEPLRHYGELVGRLRVSDRGPDRDLLGEISDEVRTSLADVRRVVDALRPPALDELGLIAAVRSRAAALTGELSVEVSGPVDRPVLPAAVETAAYRIAVEAMT